MFVVVDPGRQVRVVVRLLVPAHEDVKRVIQHGSNHIRLNICLRRELLWVAADIDVGRILVDPDPIDAHSRREDEIVIVDKAEGLRYAQVHE